MAIISDYHLYVLNYLDYLYEVEYRVENSTLFIFMPNDTYKVNLFDGSRFNKFTFYHKNRKENKGFWHEQLQCTDLEWGLFRVVSHSFNLANGISMPNKEDYNRFLKDAIKYKILKEWYYDN